jgi:threonine synthase
MTLQYASTRGGMDGASFSDVLLAGLAPDGGLVVPEPVPVLSARDLDRLRGAPYASVAAAVVARFAPEIPEAEVARMAHDAYAPSVFDHPDVVSLSLLGPGVHLAGLSHGPTLAFKDMALQMLGQLFEYELTRRGQRLTVLGATSGDTGSSAEHAMIGKRHVDVFMLSPLGRTSPFQAAQMYTLDEPNIFNLAVRGVFDDCQDLVKAVNGDAEFKARYRIGAVNSINWARIAAQVAYYVFIALHRRFDAQPVDVAVPTGNFGNVYAGFIARRMGAPIRRLIVATNENDVLAEFFATGTYRIRDAAEVAATSSPSMDISKASNFERYIYSIYGDDADAVRLRFGDLVAGGGFTVDEDARRAIAATGLVAGSSSHDDRIATIRRLAAEQGVVVDPHTADGVKVGLDLRDPDVPLVCLETARPAKFAGTIEEALGAPPAIPARFAGLLDREQHVAVVDADLDAVKRYIAAHGNDAARP